MRINLRVTGILVCAAIFTIAGACASESADIDQQGSQPVTLEGEIGCVPKKPDEQGHITNECLIGFRTPDGKYYSVGMDLEDYMKLQRENAKIVQIVGTLSPPTPQSLSQYETAGVLDAASYKIISRHETSPQEEE